MNDAARGATDTGRPGICRNCGAIVAAGEPACAQCDAPLAGVAAPARARTSLHDREAMRFARAVLTRPAPFTLIFLVANVFVFLLTTMQGGLEDGLEGLRVLVAYGAKVNSLIDGRGEWWRFVTPIFLHGGIAHLLMNMYGLWVLGPYVEKLYGSAKFVVFWIISGIVGVAASYLSVQPEWAVSGGLGRFLFKTQDAVSVGASGALFGLIGVLFVFGIKFRHELPDGFKQAFGTGMLPTILLNIFIGYAIPVIDNAAHLGGLIAGAALALIVGYKRPSERRAPVAVFWHTLQIFALALIAISFGFVARNLITGQPVPSFITTGADSPLDRETQIANYIRIMDEGHGAFTAAFNKEAGSLQAADRAIVALSSAPQLNWQANSFRFELRVLISRARRLADPRVPKQSPETEQVQLAQDYKSWLERYSYWMENELQRLRESGS